MLAVDGACGLEQAASNAIKPQAVALTRQARVGRAARRDPERGMNRAGRTVKISVCLNLRPGPELPPLLAHLFDLRNQLFASSLQLAWRGGLWGVAEGVQFGQAGHDLGHGVRFTWCGSQLGQGLMPAQRRCGFGALSRWHQADAGQAVMDAS